MTNAIHFQLIGLVERLTMQLKRANLWSDIRPSKAALQSSAPFCCDTLTFNKWLQFVFIERLSQLTKRQQPLPTRCEVTPMAEQFFTLVHQFELLNSIADIDDLLTGNTTSRPWQQTLASAQEKS